MIIDAFNAVFYQPLYNGLIFLISVLPGGSVGLAIIVLTLAVKFIILPLTHKSVASQAKMRSIEPEVAEVKKKYEKDKQEQARKVMELYQKHGINPFSGCLFIIVQIPVILALYWVFFRGLTELSPEFLYSFVTIPTLINFEFLGLFSMTGKSLFLALIAGITQYYQITLSIPPKPPVKSSGVPTFKEEFARNMGNQIRYVLPVIVFFFSYIISGAIALYWLTSNLFSIAHEVFVRRKVLDVRPVTEVEETKTPTTPTK